MGDDLTFASAARVLRLTEDEQAKLLELERGVDVERMARLLLIIFPADRAALWLRSPNKSLEGRAAVELLLGRDVDDLAHLINYLEYWAYNGW
jgi:hypothetical protein